MKRKKKKRKKNPHATHYFGLRNFTNIEALFWVKKHLDE